MDTEIEAKFVDIDTKSLRTALKEEGAVLEHPEVLMRRKNYDYPDGRLDKVGGWIRVRNEGDKTTLSYKQLIDRTLHGTKEVSVVVDDFDRTCAFLEAIGMENKAYQETRREKWTYQGTEITIDTWPWIPSFVEFEGASEESVRSAAKKFGFDWNAAMHGSVETVYQMHFDFSEEEIDSWPAITFIDPPEWLLAKKRAA